MSETALVSAEDMAVLERVITTGDLGKLNDRERLQWYVARCRSCGLDPMSKPFDYLNLKQGLVLYANKGASDQLCQKHRLTVAITEQRQINGLYVVTARAQDPSGRYTEDVGAVSIAGLGGLDLANAYMRAVTKAKRRAVLSLCGLGMMDESEAIDLTQVDTVTGEVLPPPALPNGDRAEAEAKARAGKYLFATANDLGIDTREPEPMRRVASAVLGRDVPLVRDLDAADRASVAEWMRANPEAAKALASGDFDAEDVQEGVDPPTLAAVAQAEVHETYAQAKGF